MKQRIMMAHPSGNANVRHAALAFVEANHLAELWTGINWKKSNWLNRHLPKSVVRQLSRRTFPDALDGFIKTYPLHEVSRLLAVRLGITSFATQGSGRLSANACHVSLDKKVADRIGKLRNISTVYGYEHCALESFRQGHKQGATCIYDLTSGYWKELQQILVHEVEAFPEWRSTAPSINFSDSVFSRKDQEIMEADSIVVASTFTKRTIEKHFRIQKKIHMIPYGAPDPVSIDRKKTANGKLKVLFVGALGIGKGIPYLLEALKLFGNTLEVTIIGSKKGDCSPLNEALARYRWIPSLPNTEVLSEMAKHDLFVFPSLFDGFGLVILEALSQGLPVITTDNTGGPDVIEEGVDGFIVPIRSSAAIAEKIDLLDRKRDLLADMSASAKEKARLYSWAAYRSRLVSILEAA